MNNESEQTAEQQNSTAKNFPLASRGQRLAAKVLDGLAEMVLLLPVVFYLGVADYFAAIAAEELTAFPIGLVLQVAVAGFVVHLLLHSYLLYFYGQTIGKRIMGIAMVNGADRVPGFHRLIGLRYLPFYALGQMPWFSSLALLDILFIFREDRRCLHDLLAGTRVIDVTSTPVRQN